MFSLLSLFGVSSSDNSVNETDRQHKDEQIKRDGFDLDETMKQWASEDDSSDD